MIDFAHKSDHCTDENWMRLGLAEDVVADGVDWKLNERPPDEALITEMTETVFHQSIDCGCFPDCCRVGTNE